MTNSVLRPLSLYIFAVATLPIAWLIFGQILSEPQKGAVAALCLGAALVGAAVILSRSPQQRLGRAPLLAVAGIPLLVVALCSALLNGWWNVGFFVSLFGSGFEVGTIGSLILFAATALVASYVGRAGIRMFFAVFVASVILAGAAGLASLLLFSAGTAPAFFPWPHAAFLIVAALVAASMLADGSSGVQRIYFSVSTLLLLGLLLCFYDATAVMLGAVLLGVYVAAFIIAAVARKSSFPFAGVVVAAVVAVLLLGGFSAFIKSLPLDVRPTPYVTQMVGNNAQEGKLLSVLLGTGPDSFSRAWEQHRPVELNQTALWDSAFREGYSTFLTWLAMFGYLGVFCYLLCPAVLIFAAVRAWYRGQGNGLGDPLFVTSLAVVVMVFAAGFLYLLDIVLLLAAASAIGFCARLLSDPAGVSNTAPSSRIRPVVYGAVGLILVLLSGSQIMSAWLHARGVEAYTAGNTAKADARLSDAAMLWPLPLYLRDAARARLESVRLQAEAGATAEMVQASLDQSRAMARRAVVYAPGDFAVHLSEGSLLTSLVIAGFPRLAAEAEQTLEVARQLSPTSPHPLYLLAVLAEAMGSTTEAVFFANEALRLKPDYAPAATLLKGLQGGSTL